ncbi:MAG: hypothetical protein L6R48_07105 [Planctomycetes bacterium]|nr:hypothetical protein [Planctomycetota bacterium]
MRQVVSPPRTSVIASLGIQAMILGCAGVSLWLLLLGIRAEGGRSASQFGSFHDLRQC